MTTDNLYDNRDSFCKSTPSTFLCSSLTHTHRSISYRNRGSQEDDVFRFNINFQEKTEDINKDGRVKTEGINKGEQTVYPQESKTPFGRQGKVTDINRGG